jgi:hypothetical protein
MWRWYGATEPPAEELRAPAGVAVPLDQLDEGFAGAEREGGGELQEADGAGWEGVGKPLVTFCVNCVFVYMCLFVCVINMLETLMYTNLQQWTPGVHRGSQEGRRQSLMYTVKTETKIPNSY